MQALLQPPLYKFHFGKSNILMFPLRVNNKYFPVLSSMFCFHHLFQRSFCPICPNTNIHLMSVYCSNTDTIFYLYMEQNISGRRAKQVKHAGTWAQLNRSKIAEGTYLLIQVFPTIQYKILHQQRPDKSGYNHIKYVT